MASQQPGQGRDSSNRSNQQQSGQGQRRDSQTAAPGPRGQPSSYPQYHQTRPNQQRIGFTNPFTGQIRPPLGGGYAAVAEAEASAGDNQHYQPGWNQYGAYGSIREQLFPQQGSSGTPQYGTFGQGQPSQQQPPMGMGQRNQGYPAQYFQQQPYQTPNQQYQPQQFQHPYAQHPENMQPSFPMQQMMHCFYCGSYHQPNFCPAFAMQQYNPYGTGAPGFEVTDPDNQGTQATSSVTSDDTGHTNISPHQIAQEPNTGQAVSGAIPRQQETPSSISGPSNGPSMSAQNARTADAITKDASSGSRQFKFQSSELTFNSVQAMKRVDKHASMLAMSGKEYGSEAPSNQEIEDAKGDYGLRTSFNKTSNSKEVWIAANYFPVDLKAANVKIYVYDIEMLRQVTPREIEMRNRFCKEKIFTHLRRNEPALQTLQHNSGFWVTNYDTIWSVRELFPPTAASNSVLFQQSNLQCRDQNYRLVSGVQVSISRGRVLDLSKSVAELFRGNTNIVSNYDDPAVLINGLNAIITEVARTSPHRTSTTANKFYWTNKDSAELDASQRNQGLRHTIQALSGYFASMRPSFDQLLLNVNTVTSPFFHNLTVREYAIRLLVNINVAERWQAGQLTSLPSQDVRALQTALRGLRVTLSDAIAGNSTDPTSKLRVITEIEPQANITATSDFRVNIGKSLRMNDPQNEEWHLASELTIEPFQLTNGQLRAHQTEAMIDCARRRPFVNAHLITEDGAAMFGFNTQIGDFRLANFNLIVRPQLIRIAARLLPTPTLQYGNDETTPDAASWNLAEYKFVKPITTESLAILELRDRILHEYNPAHRREIQERIDAVNRLVDSLREALEKHAMTRSRNNVKVKHRQSARVTKNQMQNYDEQAVVALFKTHLVKPEACCNVVILPNKPDYDLYATVKRAAELDLGTRTLCVTYSNLRSTLGKLNRSPHAFGQLASNLALKCNLKGQGDNHHIVDAFSPLFERHSAISAANNSNGKGKAAEVTPKSTCDTIVIGADVAHPLKAAAPGCPSIASVVGSVDDHFVSFPGSMRLQIGRKETIDKLHDMVKERLIDWAEKHNNRLPKRMLFYRDGVSESQYDKLIQEELPQLHEAYKLARAYLDNDQATLTTLNPDGDDDDKHFEDTSNTSSSKPIASSSSSKAKDEQKPTVKEQAPKEISKEQAWQAIQAGKDDFKLTYVVVGKRHNTRFFALSKEGTYSLKEPGSNGAQPTGNVMPGTLVDNTITHPFSFDFFLQSHKAIAGTGRSAHYFVLTNQMQLSTEQLQAIVSLHLIYACPLLT